MPNRRWVIAHRTRSRWWKSDIAILHHFYFFSGIKLRQVESLKAAEICICVSTDATLYCYMRLNCRDFMSRNLCYKQWVDVLVQHVRYTGLFTTMIRNFTGPYRRTRVQQACCLRHELSNAVDT